MAWTAPHTWVVDEEITAPLLNETRDNLLSIAHALDYSYSTVDVVSTATETSIYSVLVPGGALGTNGLLELIVLGDHMMNNNTGNSVTVRVKFGGTTFFSATGNTNVINGTRQATGAHAWIGNKGATNAQVLIGAIEVGMPSGGATGAAYSNLGMGGMPTTGSIDTSADQTLQVTAQWSASASGNSYRKLFALTRISQN